MSRVDRFQLILECGLLLFACSAGPVCFQVWQNGAEHTGGYWMVVGVPATAAALFVAVSLAIPNLFASGKLSFPLQFTLPVTFCALLLVSAVLWSTPAVGLLANQEVVKYAQVWELPGELLLVGASQIIGISILSILHLEPR